MRSSVLAEAPKPAQQVEFPIEQLVSVLKMLESRDRLQSREVCIRPGNCDKKVLQDVPQLTVRCFEITTDVVAHCLAIVLARDVVATSIKFVLKGRDFRS